MQVKKEDVREKIISFARSEFLEHGYTNASLRVIAEKAGLTKGAVYSYFASKDALFRELTATAVNFIESQFRHDACCAASVGTIDSYQETIKSFRSCAHAVLDHYDCFKLLLFCSAGSSLQNYKERIIQLYAQNFHRLLSFITGTEACRAGAIGEMFVHTLASTYVGFLEEIVLHEPEDVDGYAEQMAVFVYSGIGALFRHQTE